MSTVPSGRMSVLIGFIADAHDELLARRDPAFEPARAIRAAPHVAGARAVRVRARSHRAPRSPVRRAASKPMPISTPFTAGIDMIAAPRRPSSFRSHDTCEPSPTGTPSQTTSTDAAERIPFRLRGVDARDHRCSALASSVRSGEASTAALRSVGEYVGTRGVDAAEVHDVAAER